MNYFEIQKTAAKAEIADIKQKIPCALAHKEKAVECCIVCGDQFDFFYNDEEEMWQLKDAMRINDRVFHPVCFEDYRVSI